MNNSYKLGSYCNLITNNNKKLPFNENGEGLIKF
jgi:hypothetical protein